MVFVSKRFRLWNINAGPDSAQLIRIYVSAVFIWMVEQGFHSQTQKLQPPCACVQPNKPAKTTGKHYSIVLI